MLISIEIEGRKLEVYKSNLANSSNVVYDNKIWHQTSRYGAGKNYVVGLERESRNEHVWVKGDDIENLMYIVKPSGFINV